MYRSSHFRGAAIMGALSAIDIALWDIAGKHFGVPVYQLLGGKTRDKARVYYHVFGQTTRGAGRRAASTPRTQGFTAVGHLTPFLDEPRDDAATSRPTPPRCGDAIDTVRQYREAVGDEVDLCIEIHRRLTPAEAIVLARGIEQYHPFFYEDPILPDNFDAMGAGGRAHPHPDRDRRAAAHASTSSRCCWRAARCSTSGPDVCMCGGITGAKKIAALAEAHHVGVVPHNPLAPGQHGGLPADRRLHPELRAPGVPDRRGRAAEERDRQVARCSTTARAT